MRDQAIILLVEDREEDVYLIRQAFFHAGVNNPVQVVRDGEAAIAYLSGVGTYANRTEYPLPDLVLLDLNMPKVDGFEVLRWARTQPGLDDLRVVVLTSSECIRDVNKAYRFGANSFLVKPMDFENTAELGKLIQEYWLDHSKPPESIRFPGLKLPTVDEVPEDPRDEINSELDRLHAAMEQNQKLLHEAQLRIEDLEAATQAQQIALATRKSLSLPTCARVVKPVE